MDFTSEVAIAVARKPFVALTTAIKKLSTPIQFSSKIDHIIIKPSVLNPKFSGNTSFLLLQAIVKLFRAAGKLLVVESDNPFRTCEEAFSETGYTALESFGVQFENLSKIKTVPFNLPREIGISTELPALLFQNSFLINVPTLKIDPHVVIGGGIKNLLGLIPIKDKSIFHEKIVDVLLVLLSKVPPNLTILDLTELLIGPREFSETVHIGGLILGTDPVAVDSYVASLLGFDPIDIPLLRKAHELGLGEALPDRIRVVGTEHQKSKLSTLLYNLSKRMRSQFKT